MGKIDAQGYISVQAVHFAEAIPERVNLLKIDIEGAEFAVFERLNRRYKSGEKHSGRAGWLGLEQKTAAFPVVGRNRMFIQFYAWRAQ